MELNINEIVSEKIRSMHESGEIRKRIEEGVEKSKKETIETINKVIKDKKYCEKDRDK